jgi:hypothetical protein
MSRLDKLIEKARDAGNPNLTRQEEDLTVADSPIRMMEENFIEMTAGEALELADKNPECETSKVLRRSIRGMLPSQPITITKQQVMAIADDKEIILVTEPRVIGGELCNVTRRELIDRQEAQKMEPIGVKEVEEKARKQLAENNPAYSERMQSKAAAPIDTSKSSSGPDVDKAQKSTAETRKHHQVAKQNDESQNQSSR